MRPQPQPSAIIPRGWSMSASLMLRCPKEWYEEWTIAERLLWTLRQAAALAEEYHQPELAWVETTDLCKMKFHTQAQAKMRLREIGHDIRCECRTSIYDATKMVWKYRIYEGPGQRDLAL